MTAMSTSTLSPDPALRPSPPLSEELSKHLNELGLAARAASTLMARATSAQKSRALLHLAQLLRSEETTLLAANGLDLSNARAKGLSGPLYDRLVLDHKTLATCALGCEQLAAAADCIGEITGLTQQPSGIRVGKCGSPSGCLP